MLLISIVFVRCNQNNEQNTVDKNGLGSFDINKNEDQLLFSFTIAGKSSIYKSQIDGSKVKEFIKFSDSTLLFKPRYSPDGKKIVFILSRHGQVNSSLWIINVDGSSLTKLAEGLITEAVFSFDNNYIYFGKAAVYESFSPLASKNAHDFDVYCIKLKDHQIKKVTNLNAYQLSNIIDVNDNELILDLFPEGVCRYKKDGSAKLSKISPTNNKERNLDSYSKPVLVNEKSILLVSYYELVSFNLSDNKERLIFSTHGTDQFSTIRSLGKKNRLMFSYSKNDTVLYSIGLDGKGMKRINLGIKN